MEDQPGLVAPISHPPFQLNPYAKPFMYNPDPATHPPYDPCHPQYSIPGIAKTPYVPVFSADMNGSTHSSYSVTKPYVQIPLKPYVQTPFKPIQTTALATSSQRQQGMLLDSSSGSNSVGSYQSQETPVTRITENSRVLPVDCHVGDLYDEISLYVKKAVGNCYQFLGEKSKIGKMLYPDFGVVPDKFIELISSHSQDLASYSHMMDWLITARFRKAFCCTSIVQADGNCSTGESSNQLSKSKPSRFFEPVVFHSFLPYP